MKWLTTLPSMLSLVLFLTGLTACEQARDKRDNAAVIEEWRGVHSTQNAAQRLLIKDTETWEQTWQSMKERLHPTPTTPQVDFEKNMIIAVFMGQKTSGGHSIEIADIEKASNKLVVKVNETAPPPNAMTAAVMTSPYHVMVIPTSDKEVTFVTAGD